MSNKIESIQVFGTGCPACKKLFEAAQQAVLELDMKIEVEYISDIERIMSMGVMSSPVLAINNQTVTAGQSPSVRKIKELLAGRSLPSQSACRSCCGKS